MPEMLTIPVAGPIAAVSVSSAPPGGICAAGMKQDALDRMHFTKEFEQQKAHLTGLCRSVESIVTGLGKLYQETLASNGTEIARLAIEIARKILMHKTDKGDYDIQAIVEEALKRAPTRQNMIIRLNPEDLPRCQQLQRESPHSPLAELEFTADWGIGRGECLVETPKGIVQSFIEEHLDRIGEALRRVE
jgi:flagellar biosynthesis/type III secretory pathway protein FliH